MRNSRRTIRRDRAATRGVTVLELLIVMTILLMITASTIPFVLPAVQNRRMRESSRLVSTYISSARSRAIETGRPVGVQFQRFNALPLAYTLSYVEVPPPYSGESAAASCQVSNSGSIQANVGVLANFNPAQIRVGDQIQFNFQGPRYTITGPDLGMMLDGIIDSPPDSMTPTTLTLGPLPAGVRAPWTATPVRATYQIFRQPVGSSMPPLQLPEGICVDLHSSGIGSSGVFPIPETPPILPADWTTKTPLTFDPIVMFGPNGSFEWVYVAPDRLNAAVPVRPSGPVFFLIGRRDLMADVSKNSPQVDENLFDPRDPRLMPMPPPTPAPTFGYLENFWVTISPQTGLVTVTQMALNPKAQNQPMSIPDARLNAITGQSQGGR